MANEEGDGLLFPDGDMGKMSVKTAAGVDDEEKNGFPSSFYSINDPVTPAATISCGDDNSGRSRCRTASRTVCFVGGLILLNIVLVMATARIMMATYVKEHSQQQQQLEEQQEDVIYGFIHMSYSGGTPINGELALRAERVCGNKGYSFDAYGNELRVQASHETSWGNLYHSEDIDSYAASASRQFRGFVGQEMMDEIGYEDCDWIGNEQKWKFWTRFENWATPIEIHMSCRDPVDHYITYISKHHSKDFDCDADLDDWFDFVYVDQRYSSELEQLFPVKCFDYTRRHEYVELMAEHKLQPRRHYNNGTCTHCEIHDNDQNHYRGKTTKSGSKIDCLWNDSKLRERVRQWLIKNHDYHRFCDRCMGSADDLLR